MYYIALQMIFGDKGKFFAMVFGVMFSSLIMTQQPSIFVGLMSRTFAFIGDVTSPDIWVMDPAVQFVEENKPLRDTDLGRVRGVAGVAWAVPMFKGLLLSRLPDGTTRTIDINGLDDATLVGGPPIMVQGTLEALRQNDGIIISEEAARTRMQFTDETGVKRPLRIGDAIEINDRRAVIVGLCKSTRNFTLQPLVYTTYNRALQFSPNTRKKLSYILVKVQPGQDVAEVSKRITAATGLAAYSGEEFKKVTLSYWMKNTGIPINFGISVMLGFLVGAAVVGQTFYNAIRENLRQYGALKAMGARDSVLVRMVMLQAFVVGLIGYGLGVGLTAFFGTRVKDSVLAFNFRPEILIFAAVGVSLMIIISALLGIRQVLKLDPAIVFKS